MVSHTCSKQGSHVPAAAHYVAAAIAAPQEGTPIATGTKTLSYFLYLAPQGDSDNQDGIRTSRQHSLVKPKAPNTALVMSHVYLENLLFLKYLDPLSRPLNSLSLLKDKTSEFEKTQWDSPEPEARVVVPDRSQTPGEESSVSECFSCVSSPGTLQAAAEDEFKNSQEDSPQLEAHVVVPDHSQTPGEESSASEYFSCMLSPGTLQAAAEDGGGGGIPQWYQDILLTEPLEVTLPEVLEEREAPSVSTKYSFPPYLGTARVKIYYRRVQMKRGVALSWDEVEVLEPASKKTKREFAFFEEAEKKGEEVSDIWSRLSTQELVDITDYSEASEEREQAVSAGEPPAQDREQLGSAVGPPAQEECPRAKTPEWLVALDSGFRCLGCCQVFHSLEVLQDHMDNAVREGFSCRVFHRILAWLNNKNKKEEDEEEEN